MVMGHSWRPSVEQVASEGEGRPRLGEARVQSKGPEFLLRLRTSMDFEINRVHTEPGSSRGAQVLAKTVLGEERCKIHVKNWCL